MSEARLVDTGPLVAFLNRRDRHHAWSVEALGGVRPPLETCEAVLSEACFLLRKAPGGADSLMELVERELIVLRFDAKAEIAAVRRLLARYAEVPMSFADACLVRMSEQRASCRLLTLDSDFRRYRRHGRQTIPLLAPAS